MQPINLHEVQDGHTVRGLLYITNYTKKLDPTSKAPLNGVATYLGKTLGFKIWGGPIQDVFNTHDLDGTIVDVTAKAGTYRDKLELTIDSVNFDHGFTDVNVFYKSIDVDSRFKEFTDFINTHLSSPAITTVSTVFRNENLFESFKTGWAAMRMHDAQVGGLLNHTYKMLQLAKTMIENDARLAEFSDLLYVSLILHDIGKVYELGEGGTYTENSFVGHRTIGVEIVARQKQVFVENFGETFYYHILEVITGHHGEYGDKPKTVISYLVHLIDMLDSQTTGFLDKLENGEISERNGQRVVWNHGENLVV